MEELVLQLVNQLMVNLQHLVKDQIQYLVQLLQQEVELVEQVQVIMLEVQVVQVVEVEDQAKLGVQGMTHQYHHHKEIQEQLVLIHLLFISDKAEAVLELQLVVQTMEQ